MISCREHKIWLVHWQNRIRQRFSQKRPSATISAFWGGPAAARPRQPRDSPKASSMLAGASASSIPPASGGACVQISLSPSTPCAGAGAVLGGIPRLLRSGVLALSACTTKWAVRYFWPGASMRVLIVFKADSFIKALWTSRHGRIQATNLFGSFKHLSHKRGPLHSTSLASPRACILYTRQQEQNPR
jgi:hypothetical protein